MTTKDVANQLVQMCRDGKIEEAKQEFFTEDTLSVEPAEGVLPKETKGLEAIQKKAELFISMVEQFYGSTITDPVVAGDYFSVGWDTDIQMKGEERKTSGEICLYKVKDGKIVSEQFFYELQSAIKI
ncbi:MAG: SnoaL-like domain-containing protein [Ginsengibacter sp.]